MPHTDSGSKFEDCISEILETRDYEYIQKENFFEYVQKDNLFLTKNISEIEQCFYTRQCKTGDKSIYGKDRIIDLMLYHPRLFPNCLAIECKWQESPGTTEEKFPFLVLNIAQGDYDTIIILDGNGYTPGARQWVLDQAGKNRLMHVFTQADFQKFIDKGRLG